MSQENVQAVRRMYEAHNAGDIEAVLAEVHPDLVFVELPQVPGASTYYGKEGYRDFLERWRESFPEVRWEVLRTWDVGDSVVVETRAVGAGTASRVEIDMVFASVVTLRNGKAIRHEAFASVDEALAAAGLSESETTADTARVAENVEALKAAYEAFRVGELDAALAIMDPDIEVSDHDRVLDSPKQYYGPAGVVQMAAEAAESFDDHRYEPEDFREVQDQILVAVRRRGRGKGSGIEVDERQWHLWEFRGEKAVRLQTFVDESKALGAAGLR